MWVGLELRELCSPSGQAEDGDTECVFRTRVSEPGQKRSDGKRLMGFVSYQRGHTSPRFSSWQSWEQVGTGQTHRVHLIKLINADEGLPLPLPSHPWISLQHTKSPDHPHIRAEGLWAAWQGSSGQTPAPLSPEPAPAFSCRFCKSPHSKLF